MRKAKRADLKFLIAVISPHLKPTWALNHERRQCNVDHCMHHFVGRAGTWNSIKGFSREIPFHDKLILVSLAFEENLQFDGPLFIVSMLHPIHGYAEFGNRDGKVGLE
jgi:hypothetical protein